MFRTNALLKVSKRLLFRASRNFSDSTGLPRNVETAAKALAKVLDENNIPYCFVGGVALNALGATTDIDVLTTSEGIQLFAKKCLGRGYTKRFAEAQKSFRDTTLAVDIDFIASGEFPGDGKQKEVIFPTPTKETTFQKPTTEGPVMTFLCLKDMINLKLASATVQYRQYKDLNDVMALIETNSLPISFAEELYQSVREKYCEMWHLVQQKKNSRQE